MPCKIPSVCQNQTLGSIVSSLLNNSVAQVEFPFGSFGPKTNCSTLEIDARILNFNGRDYETLYTFNSSNFKRNNVANSCQLIINKTLTAFNDSTYNDLHTI